VRGWKLWSVLGLSAAALLAGPTLVGPALADSPAHLKIGAIMALTGSLQAYGESSLNGIKLAVEEINGAGGVLGQPVELAVGDDQTNPQAGIDAAQKLVSVERVNALVGALSSGVTIPIASTISGKLGIPQISGASTSPVISSLDSNGFLFRTIPSDAFQGVAMAQIAQEKGFKSVSVLYVNNDYGIGLAQAFEKAFSAAGGKVTNLAAYAEKQSSYRGELQKAAQGHPEGLVLIAYPGDGIPILKQALEGGFFAKFLFSDGMKAPEVALAIGPRYLEGMAGTSPQPLTDSPTALAFASHYKAKFGQLPPKPYIDSFYDAVYVLALAAEKAHSADPKAIRDNLRIITKAGAEKVGPGEFAKAKALLAAGKDVDYIGAAGHPAFDSHGDVAGTFAHWEFKGGTVETIKVFEPK